MSGRPSLARFGWLVLWLALSVGLLVAVWAIPWSRVAVLVARQHVVWALLAIVLNLTILPVWAAEWVRLAPSSERPAYRRALDVVAITSATLNTVPFFAGEASAVVLLVARAGLSRAGALSVLALDQLLVGLAKLTTIAAAAIVTPLPLWLRGGVLTLATAVVMAGTLLLTAAHVPNLPVLRAWGSRLDTLRDPRRMAVVFALALLKKSVEVLAIVTAQHAMGMQLPWWSGILVVAGLGIGTLLPIAPGNLGTYEATAFVIYRSLGVPTDAALSLALIQHLYFLIAAIAPGWLLLLVRQLTTSGPALREE